MTRMPASLPASGVAFAALWIATGAAGQAPDSPSLSALRVRAVGPVLAGGTGGVVHGLSVDMAVPFRVHAALDGGGAWTGPSTVWRRGGIRSAEWTRVGAGLATDVLVDPRDPRYVHSATRAGEVTRYDRKTAERKGIRPWAPQGVELGFGRTTPLAHDPFRPELLYVGSQFVHRTGDRGATWQIISGDLTRGGTEPSASISSIAPSPVQEEVLWVGTEDGRLHLTRSSGGTWTDLTDRLPGDAPSAARITHVEASRHHGGTAFVAVGDRRSEGRGPHLYRSGDYGRSWEPLGVGEGGGLEGAVHVVEQDPLARGLVFAGTSRGLFVSLDGGARWLRWDSGLPDAPVRALLIHPRDYDLVVGTDGRGVYVLDDIRPFRALARDPGLVERPLHVFDLPPAYLHHRAGSRATGPATDDSLRARSRPYGALLTYHVGPEAAGDSLRLEVLDGEERVVRRKQVPGARGVRRVAWDLGVDAPCGAPPLSAGPNGLPLLRALPGRYTVRLRSPDGAADEASVRVLPDPRSELTLEERVTGHEALVRALRVLRVPEESEVRLGRVESAVETMLERLAERPVADADSLTAAGRRLVERAAELGARARSVSRDGGLLRALSGSFGPPTEAQRIALQEAEKEMEGLAHRVNDFLLGRISLYNDHLRAAGLEPLPDFDEVGRPPSP